MKVFMKGALAKAAPPAAAFSYKLCDERHICVSGHVGSNSQDIQYEDASDGAKRRAWPSTGSGEGAAGAGGGGGGD